MRQRYLIQSAALMIACVMLGAVFADDADPADAWLIKYEQAVEQSRQTGRPILAYFTGSDWCAWCRKFDEEVLDTGAFMQWASERVILLKLDFPKGRPQADDVKQQNLKLKEKYQVNGFPAVLFLNADGDVVNKTGYRPGGAEAWVKHADQLLSPAASSKS